MIVYLSLKIFKGKLILLGGKSICRNKEIKSLSAIGLPTIDNLSDQILAFYLQALQLLLQM